MRKIIDFDSLLFFMIIMFFAGRMVRGEDS
jgi:hypothetical protein